MPGNSVFNRHIDVDAEDLGDEIAVRGHLKDKYHEMEVRMRLRKEGLLILDVEGFMIQGATCKCPLAEAVVGKLKGLTLGKGFRARALELMGRTLGCTHMTSLILQINDNAVLLDSFYRDEDIYPGYGVPWQDRPVEPEMEANPRLVNACIAFKTDEAPADKPKENHAELAEKR